MTVVVPVLLLATVFRAGHALVLWESESGEPAIPGRPGEFGALDGREARRVTGQTYPRSEILSRMLQMPQWESVAGTASDPFDFLRDQYPLPNGSAAPLASYDYVVVGGGSAGCVLAARLSAGGRASVLLLEAGRTESLFTDVPILAPLLQQTHYTWPYLMERQEGICLGMEQQRCFWPRGRAVGGSSVINYMIYSRGRPEDWDRIAADGNYGWSYSDVLPFYLKSERATLCGRGNSSWHGNNGQLSVEDVPFRAAGIGPKEHLQRMGIPVMKDLKVGQTLYDHISFPGLTFLLNTTRLTLVERKISNIENINQWWQFGDGPMSSLAGVENIGYIKTTVSAEIGDYPDIELIGTCASLASDRGHVVRRGLKITDQFYEEYFKPIEGTESFSIIYMLLHPKSKGYMRLRDSNPFHDPKLYGNYLTHRSDVDTMIAAIRYIIKLVETAPYQKYGARLYARPIPNCITYEFGSDAYWECAIRTLTATLHHQIATCKMGPPSDADAVVDPELRVYGIKGLRVAESSVIPRTLAAHTNAPAIMIGEKAAEMITNS